MLRTLSETCYNPHVAQLAQRERQRERERKRERQTVRDTKRERERAVKTERQTDRQTERDRQRENFFMQRCLLCKDIALNCTNKET